MKHNHNTLNSRIIFLLFSISMILSLVAGACQPTTPQIETKVVPVTTENQVGSITSQPDQKTITPQPIEKITVTSTPAPHLQVDPKKLKGVKIVLWHPWVDEMDLQLSKMVAEFNKSNEWGINVETVTLGSSSQVYNQVQSGIKDNKLPHLIISPIENLTYWQSRHKMFVNLNDYIFDSTWGLSEKDVADFPKIFWDQDNISGYRLGVPAQRNMQALFYNLSWAKELGFTKPPATIDEFTTQACGAAQSNLGIDISATSQSNATKVAQVEASATLDATAIANATADAITNEETNPLPQKATPTPEKTATGGMIFDSSPLSILSWLMAFNGGQIPADENQPYKFNTQSNSEAYKFLRELYDAGCIWMSRLPQPYEYFSNRQALFYSGTIQDVMYQAKAQARIKSNDEWTTLMFPTKSDKPTVLVSGPSYAIIKTSPEEQLAAWLFIRWLSSPENQANIVRATGSVPVRITAIDLLNDYGIKNPQWQKANSWVPMAKPAPNLGSWRTVRNIIQDATWHIFQNTSINQIPSQLEQMDLMIPEVLKQE